MTHAFPTNLRGATALTPLLAALALWLPGCNRGEGPAPPGHYDAGPADLGNTANQTDGGDGGGGGGADMAMCSAIPRGDCSTCLQANCNAELTACFDGTWPSTGSMNGICAGLFPCACECEAKGGANCTATCATQRGAMCATCMATVAVCRAKSCAARCP